MAVSEEESSAGCSSKSRSATSRGGACYLAKTVLRGRSPTSYDVVFGKKQYRLGLSSIPLTAPILGSDHTEYRCRGSMAKEPKALDGDMLAQFLELTSMRQEAVLALPLGAQNTIMFNSKQSPAPITVNQVVRLLEHVHYALN